MGSASSKFKKYLQHGDEFAAMQVYQNSQDLRENLDPSCGYGDSHNNNTPLHYASKHGMKHLVRAFLWDHGGNPNKKNSDDETALHFVCRMAQAKSPSAEERRTSCIAIILQWRGPVMQDGEKEKPEINSQDKTRNTALHYAASSGLKKCVELLIAHGSNPFLENKDRMTPCDMAVKARHYDIAAYLEARMVFADSTDTNESESLKTFSGESDEADSEMYTGLRQQDLQEAKDQLLVETADMLHIPLFTAEALLRDNEWSKTLLLEKWMANAVQCCEIAGIAPPTSALQLVSPSPSVGETNVDGLIITPPSMTPNEQESPEDKPLCEICFDEMFPWETSHEGPSCGHKFCLSCWESYLSLKIIEGGAHHILCPAVDCSILVEADFIEKMVSPDVARKYLQFDIEAFVEKNKTIKWCPLPGCGRAVRYPEAERTVQAFHFPNMKPPPKTSHAVDCGNGHFFCWECLGEAHSPSGCDQWLLWQTKVAEIKPEELQISSGETDEAANFLWLVTNSKPCPNCKSPIQKNEGCNHMKCSKCKHDFCWVCLESWKKHSSGTGGYFRCNRYDAKGKADDKLGVLLSEATVRNHQMQELSRFIHYYTRFKNHQNSLHLEEPLLRRARSKMAVLASSVPENKKMDGPKEKRTTFVEESIKEVLKARRVLCGSYVYGYFLQDNGYNKTIFEFMQNELEEICEKLSEMVARQYLITPRNQIIATTLLTRRRRHKFVRAVARGLLPPETPPGLRKVRRRIPFISMEGLNEEFVKSMDTNKHWIKDSAGRHTNIAAFLDWPDFDSDDEESSLNQALTLTLLGKCNRKSCPRPRARNIRTGTIHHFCSLRCAQLAGFCSNGSSDTSVAVWEGCDSNMELLIALEMSRLQMIEDEARRRQSLLQEHSNQCCHEKDIGAWRSREYFQGHLSNMACAPRECRAASCCQEDTPVAPSCEQTKFFPSDPVQNDGQSTSLSCPVSCTNVLGCQLSSAEIAVDYFLKKLANNEISLRNLNVDTPNSSKVDKELLRYPKTNSDLDGRFLYGDLHENAHLLPLISDPSVDLRRSFSLGDLDRAEIEPNVDSDHAHQENPEEKAKLRLSKPLKERDSSVDFESESGATDQGAPSEIMGELDSPLTDLEVRGILSHLDAPREPSPLVEPSFQLVIDEGTDKEENSTSTSSQNKSSLRIHISNKSNETDTGIPNSPTLYISGVSISRSPEPRSPKSCNKENRSPSLNLPLSRTPEPRVGRLSPLPVYNRSRSSSLIVPTASAKLPQGALNLSSLSLQGTRVSSPFLIDMRVSKSASEPEKGRLVFQFPKSPTEGALSSVLHVEESTLSSDDFHEALFLSKSPRPSKRKKSKRERNRSTKLERTEEQAKDIIKEWKEKHKNCKERKKLKDSSNVV